MQSIYLNDKLLLSFEPLGKRVRLIISSADTEIVCRKETIKNLQDFLQTTETNIFKGRLQLSKNANEISVKVKGQLCALIYAADFEQALNNLA